jgi:hypothetical protein
LDTVELRIQDVREVAEALGDLRLRNVVEFRLRHEEE